MDFILNWLREEREVIRRAKVTAALILALGLIVGFSASSFLYDRRVDDAQQAVATAQQNRDLWKDKYDDLAASPTPKKVPEKVIAPRAQPSPTRQVDPVRTGLLAAAILAGLMMFLFVVPLPRRKGAVSLKDLARPATPETAEALRNHVIEAVRGRKADALVAAMSPKVATSDAPSVAPSVRAPAPVHYLHARPGEKAARPQVKVLSAQIDAHHPPNKGRQIRGTVTIENDTMSMIAKCRVTVETIQCGGVEMPIFMPLVQGDKGEFPITAGDKKSLIFMWREYRVAPEQPMKLNAGFPMNALSPAQHFQFDDNKVYLINICVDPGTGVVTRAVLGATIGEYEHLKVSLIDQASWRLSPTGTGAGTLQ
jgi:hypothetical protein